MSCRGVLATGKRRRVALLTPTSVACADSSTAVSSSNTLVYASSEVGLGLACLRVAKKASMSCAFMGRDCRLARSRSAVVSLRACAGQGGLDHRALALEFVGLGEARLRREVVEL